MTTRSTCLFFHSQSVEAEETPPASRIFCPILQIGNTLRSRGTDGMDLLPSRRRRLLRLTKNSTKHSTIAFPSSSSSKASKPAEYSTVWWSWTSRNAACAARPTAEKPSCSSAAPASRFGTAAAPVSGPTGNTTKPCAPVLVRTVRAREQPALWLRPRHQTNPHQRVKQNAAAIARRIG